MCSRLFSSVRLSLWVSTGCHVAPWVTDEGTKIPFHIKYKYCFIFVCLFLTFPSWTFMHKVLGEEPVPACLMSSKEQSCWDLCWGFSEAFGEVLSVSLRASLSHSLLQSLIDPDIAFPTPKTPNSVSCGKSERNHRCACLHLFVCVGSVLLLCYVPSSLQSDFQTSPGSKS